MKIFKGPWRITFNSNPDMCNLSCIMCELHNPVNKQKKVSPRILDFSVIEKVVREASEYGLKEIIPCDMGEPFLYPYLEDLISLCKEYDVKLNITTNGTFPKKGADEWARLIVPITRDIKISWNGFRKETSDNIMLGSDYDVKLKNLKDFIEVRDEIYEKTGVFCRVSLQMTFMRNNYLEMHEIIKLAASLAVNRFKGHHVWVHNKEMEKLSLKTNNDFIEKWNKCVSKVNEIVNENRLPNGDKILIEHVYPLGCEKNNFLNEECPFLGKEAWVSVDGFFQPCGAPDGIVRDFGYFGDLRNQNIIDIWKSGKYKRLCDNYKNLDICRKCLQDENSYVYCKMMIIKHDKNLIACKGTG